MQITDSFLWDKITISNIKHLLDKVSFLLNEFGTKEPCNRFDVGNSIEFMIRDLLINTGLDVQALPNAKRVDLYISGYGELSVKYSSIGDITLHNSNSCVNSDENISDLILLTNTKLYLITKAQLQYNGINIQSYTKNTGDSLKLKRTFLSFLDKTQYPYSVNINLNIDKSKCKNRLCSELFYEMLNKEFEQSLK